MYYVPNSDDFQKLAQARKLVPIYRQLVSDTLTPVSAFCKIQESGHSFLFESVTGGEKIGRFSFVGTDPFLQIEACGNEVILTENGEQKKYTADDPLQELQQLLERFHAVHIDGLPRFCGGAVGFAGYDTIRYSESLPNAPTDDRQLPDMSFAFYDRMIVFDQINKTVQVVAHARTDVDNLDLEYRNTCKRVDELCRKLQQSAADLQLTDISVTGDVNSEWNSNFIQNDFEAAVETCKDFIRAGDIFQVVLSQRFQRDIRCRPLDIYRALRVVNPSPFMFLLSSPSVKLVGCSPEVMVRVEDDEITVRPLAGTRQRGRTHQEDQRLAEELLADPKERAEHVMLIDLARNDVGRVAKFGSIELSDVMHVERYSHVMHITSNVTAMLNKNTTALDALRACLPAGTVSGAPKVRAMEIIDELEPHRRGPYAGAVGYIDFTGNMDTCIALRTLVVKGQTAYIQVGAGIVADSIPANEFQETLNKARGLLKAVQIAEEQL